MHIFEDHFIAEVIDPDTGALLPPGAVGELVLTTLTKEAIPVIRYRTRDITRLSYERCSCGRTLARMEKTRGRSDDMLIIKGVNVFPTQINESIFFDEMKKQRAFIDLVEKRLASTLNVGARVRLVEPASMPRHEGKAQRVIDKRKR
jgi:phenylacetate-CoA ligase